MAHIEGPDQVDGALHKLVLKSLDDDLAQEIVTIDLAGKSALADHMVGQCRFSCKINGYNFLGQIVVKTF